MTFHGFWLIMSFDFMTKSTKGTRKYHQEIIFSKDGNRSDLHPQISSERNVATPPIYLYLIFAILQFEISILMNLIFSLFQT